MSTQSATYDPAWEQLFGEFELIPSLKPRPGDVRTQIRRPRMSPSPITSDHFCTGI